MRYLITLAFTAISSFAVAGEIHDAVADGKLPEMKKLISNNPKLISAVNNYKETPLHIAAHRDHFEIAVWLLENGANVDAFAYNQFTPLHLASDPSIVAAILRHKPNLETRDAASCQTPLERAASEVARRGTDAKRWQQIVKALLDGGASYTIDAAIYLDDVQQVRQLLKSNAKLVNDRRGAQNLPLRLAAKEGRVEICRMLLENNADVDDLKEGLGLPIVCDAVRHPEVVKLLLDAGANVKQKVTWRIDKTGRHLIADNATALHYAAQCGSVESVRLLLDAEVPIDAADSDGTTALHIAVMRGTPQMVRCLLEHGANPRTKRQNGRTPLELAEQMATNSDDSERKEADVIVSLLKQVGTTSNK